MNKKTINIAYWIALVVVAVAGLIAIVMYMQKGLRVTNLTTTVPWGLWVAFYAYFIGLSVGSYLVSTMIYVFGIKRFEPIGRIALFSAFISFCAGMVFVLFDLGHMERFWTIFVNRSATSLLQWETQFYILYMVILLAQLWLLIRRDLIRKSDQSGLMGLICRLLTLGSKDTSNKSVEQDLRMVKILAMLGLPTAVLGVVGLEGSIFAVTKARPYWNTSLFPIIFMASALVSGGALLTFIHVFFGRKNAQHAELAISLGKLVAGFLAIDLILLCSEILVGLYNPTPDHAVAFQAILYGPSAYVFWVVQIGLGAVVPLFLILNRNTGASPLWIGVAAVLVVIGIFAVRLNIIIPPFMVPLAPGIGAAYSLGRFAENGANFPLIYGAQSLLNNTPFYKPTDLEWLSSLGVIALSIIGFILGWMFLPLDEENDSLPA